MQSHPLRDQYGSVSLKAGGIKQVAASPVLEAGLEEHPPAPAPHSPPSRGCKELQHLRQHQHPYPDPPGLWHALTPRHSRDRSTSPAPGARGRIGASSRCFPFSPAACRQRSRRTAPARAAASLAPLQPGRSPHPPPASPGATGETRCLRALFYFSKIGENTKPHLMDWTHRLGSAEVPE